MISAFVSRNELRYLREIISAVPAIATRKVEPAVSTKTTQQKPRALVYHLPRTAIESIIKSTAGASPSRADTDAHAYFAHVCVGPI